MIVLRRFIKPGDQFEPPISLLQVTAAEAETRIRAINEPYKLQILQSILARDPNQSITIYHIGDQADKQHWWDLCAGPHVERTGSIDPESFDLESVAGA